MERLHKIKGILFPENNRPYLFLRQTVPTLLPLLATALFIALRSNNHAFAVSTEDRTAECLTYAY